MPPPYLWITKAPICDMLIDIAVSAALVVIAIG